MIQDRKPAVAGRFYPASAEECTRMLETMIRPVERVERPLAAVVPHAGWPYSGPTAALAYAALAPVAPQTIVIFGAVHVLDPNHASVYPGGSWHTPLGALTVDEELAGRLSGRGPITADTEPHAYEHSIEVQLPFIQHLLGDVKILPIMVRPGHTAGEVGRLCAAAVADLGRRAVLLASTDLTHYGPAFGFEPHGRGEEGVRWAKEVNDRRFVERIAALDAEGVLREGAAHRNACGAGAVAAVIGAVRELGADRYVELEHTTSAEVERESGGVPMNSVGYEAGIFTISG